MGLNGQLATAAGMRTHGPEVEVSYGNTEPLARGRPQRLGCGQLLGIKIDVRVKIANWEICHKGKIAGAAPLFKQQECALSLSAAAAISPRFSRQSGACWGVAKW